MSRSEADQGLTREALEAQEPTAVVEEPARPRDLRRFVLITVGSHWLGLPVSAVAELVDMREPTPLPGAPAHVAGLVVIRGRATPVLDLEAFLGLERRDGQALDAFMERLVVVSTGGMRVGILSGRVPGIQAWDAATFTPPSALHPQRLRPLLSDELDDGERLVGIVDVGALLDAARVD